MYTDQGTEKDREKEKYTSVTVINPCAFCSVI